MEEKEDMCSGLKSCCLDGRRKKEEKMDGGGNRGGREEVLVVERIREEGRKLEANGRDGGRGT